VPYAVSADGARLAFEVSGDGPVDLLELSTAGPSLSIDSTDEQPLWRRYEERLAAIGRLIRYDARGVGLSDPYDRATPITPELLRDDALAVLDAAGVDRAYLVATMPGAWAAVSLAATWPERVRGLVLIHAVARAFAAPDYPIGVPEEDWREALRQIDTGQTDRDDVALVARSKVDAAEFRLWWQRAGQRGASPGMARRRFAAMADLDTRALLPTVTAPTLVLHRRDNPFIPVAAARYLAAHIPGAVLVELDGVDHVPWLGDADAIVDEIEEFITGTRQTAAAHRVLAAVVFTDIVDSTAHASRVGDAAWRRTLDDHDGLVARNARVFGGRLVKTTGDGALVTFDAPGNAVRFALAVGRGATGIGVSVRAGVHVGEIEVRGDDVGGLAVHLAARVAAVAGADEVLVTRTVKDLTIGAPFTYADRGVHRLKGVPDEWPLLAVTAAG
jgi:pimeloyl-ACP methyl ester carboxylesterase